MIFYILLILKIAKLYGILKYFSYQTVSRLLPEWQQVTECRVKNLKRECYVPIFSVLHSKERLN